MSATIADISWAVLRRIVQQWKGTSAEPAELLPLDGGCINTTVRVSTSDGDKAVLKISPHRVDRTYAREAYQLRLLAAAGAPVPQVFEVFTGSLEEPFSYLLMEWVEGQDLAHVRRAVDAEEFDHLQSDLAALLRKIHSQHSAAFGVIEPSANGDAAAADSALQPSWPACFRAIYDPIVAESRKVPAIHVKSHKMIDRLHDHLDRYLPQCEPSLTHWDLWSSNVLAAPNGDGHWHIAALLDPMCTWADPQAELAYLELFHTITPAFMKTYQGETHLGDSYHRVAKPIYQLYALLNHAVLHGLSGEPLATLNDRLERVAGLV